MDAQSRRAGRLPLIYACSGGSAIAQLANRLVVELDREQAAQMSCIAGVGGDVPALVRLARSGRRIVALDGCALQCVAHCLARHAVKPDLHYTLTELGITKHFGAAFPPGEAAALKRRIAADLALPIAISS